MRQPIQVLVYAVRRCGDRREYLLLHRVAHREEFWQGVTGGVEAGETLLEAARRELQEETGFTPEQVADIDYTYTFPLADQWRALFAFEVAEIREHVFLAEVTGHAAPILDPREHDIWRWCGFEEALQLLHWPDNVEALRRAEAWLRQRECGAGGT